MLNKHCPGCPFRGACLQKAEAEDNLSLLDRITWADDAVGEAAMWSSLVERLDAFPDAPVYHYGNYERKAFTILAKRHGKGGGLADRLVNVASSDRKSTRLNSSH